MIPTPPPPRRARLLGISVLSAVFVAGALASAAVVRLLDAREASAAPQAVADAPACKAEKRGRMIDQIDLSPEQRRQVDAIVERRRAQREEFWENEGRRMRVISDSTRMEIRGVLLPAQQAQYDRLLAEHRARSEAKKAAADSARAASASAGQAVSSSRGQ